MPKEREALSPNDTNTSEDISGINSLDTSKADSTRENERSKLKVNILFLFVLEGFVINFDLFADFTLVLVVFYTNFFP